MCPGLHGVGLLDFVLRRPSNEPRLCVCTEEFRRKVLDPVASARPVAQIAADLGLSDQTIYSCRKQDLIDINQLPGPRRPFVAHDWCSIQCTSHTQL
jgi:hypothetical protein